MQIETKSVDFDLHKNFFHVVINQIGSFYKVSLMIV